LQRLERDGLVATASGDVDGEAEGPQKSYQITAGGRRELVEWLQIPPDDSQPPRDELLMKVLVALGVSGIDVHAIIQVHRRHLVELMQRYTSVKADADSEDVALALVVDSELFRIEGVVRWLDSAETRLQRHQTLVPPSPRSTNTVVAAARRNAATIGGPR
jgi:DNA-binding PadR family transcriptional regulator